VGPKAKTIRLFIVALFAEIGASLWLLLLAPLDGPTEMYSGFLGYEAWRALCWAPLAAIIALLSAFVGQKLAFRKGGLASRNSSPLRFLISATAIGLSVETLTSICYWKSPHSRGVRALYQSVWYWHRVPRQSDFGWPSFRGYYVDHLIPWAMLFLTGLIAWFMWTKRRQSDANKPATVQSNGTTR
jgi:hypothetical protein